MAFGIHQNAEDFQDKRDMAANEMLSDTSAISLSSPFVKIRRFGNA
jgi:hypothetical protein